MPEDERVAAFCAAFQRGTKYPAKSFFEWHHKLTGSCLMGRNEFAREHGINVDTEEMTVDEFFALTRSAYGGSVIRKAEAALQAQPCNPG